MPRSFLVKKKQDQLQQLTARSASHDDERQMLSSSKAAGKKIH
jgi:hypothetical protein